LSATGDRLRKLWDFDELDATEARLRAHEYAEAGDHQAALDAFERALESRLLYPENVQATQWARESVEEARTALV